MGNCIVLQEKFVKVMKIDGKILEYKAPIKVHQVLSQFSGHVISNSLQVIDNQHLQPDDDLLGGQIYYLLPQLPVQPPPKSAKKKVKFANDQVELEANQKTEVVRIKIVISKKELQALLNSEDGLIKVDDIKSTTIVDESTTNGIGWKPVLDIIPELD
ncbi:hypothetical protein K7X08_015599 [Anisodus acutangulus]|uniref:Uncharacterized protein n=2 Tax=Anisodus TaxID=243963 RepID=A0A9Q1LB31_9SOLA|nr:hypothetical protein K7X08_015599 [Anisodus acutangulus]KAK4343180.1 hypothetical protein RND71_038996 [Anisodus tanguticus]